MKTVLICVFGDSRKADEAVNGGRTNKRGAGLGICMNRSLSSTNIVFGDKYYFFPSCRG